MRLLASRLSAGGPGAHGEGAAAPAGDGAAKTSESRDVEGTSPDEAARDGFVSMWGAHIDAFDAGTPLEGCGQAFVAAACDCGVDSLYAPAIVHVGSGSGANCTYACNAWGWGTDWDTAIWEFTVALGASYGSTLTYESALSYNPETPDEWYAQVEANMYQIWESDGIEQAHQICARAGTS